MSKLRPASPPTAPPPGLQAPQGSDLDTVQVKARSGLQHGAHNIASYIARVTTTRRNTWNTTASLQVNCQACIRDNTFVSCCSTPSWPTCGGMNVAALRSSLRDLQTSFGSICIIMDARDPSEGLHGMTPMQKLLQATTGALIDVSVRLETDASVDPTCFHIDMLIKLTFSFPSFLPSCYGSCWFFSLACTRTRGVCPLRARAHRIRRSA